MSYSADKLLKLATEYEQSVEKFAKADPKVVFPANKSKDNKEHFPINDEAQARNALARANQFKAVPDWFGGSLETLVSTVAKAVKKHYPNIDVSKAAKTPGKG